MSRPAARGRWTWALAAGALAACAAPQDSGEPDKSPVQDVDLDDDGTPSQRDCDDADNSTSPAAPELCADGVDNDCDGLLDADDPDCAAAQSPSAKTGPSSLSRSANKE